MTEKLIGGLVVIVSSAIWGSLRGADERKKLSSLGEFIDLVNFIGGNIDHFRTPLCEIYRQYASTGEENHRHSAEMAEFLSTAEREGIASAWNNEILTLPDEAKPNVRRFVTEIGRGYAEEEAELCRFTAENLTSIFDMLKEDIGGKVKMWRTLPPLLASSVMLIFL